MARLTHDLTGCMFGDWEVLSKAGPVIGSTKWLCRCTCGTLREVPSGNLRRGMSKSCGCKRPQKVSLANTKHGYASKAGKRSSLYNIWATMKQRCGKYPGYENVQMYQEWRDSFEAFLRDVGEPPTPKHSLDRFPDNKGNYEPGNVRWATQKQQGRNKKNTIKLTYRGVERSLQEWADVLEIPAVTLHARIKRYGMSVEEAFNTPIREQKNNVIPEGVKRGQNANEDEGQDAHEAQQVHGGHDGKEGTVQVTEGNG